MAGPYVFILSPIVIPITASMAWTKIINDAMAMSQTFDLLKKVTRLARASGALRAVAYNAFVRASPSDVRAAATEKPRLVNALIAVIAAQDQNDIVMTSSIKGFIISIDEAQCRCLMTDIHAVLAQQPQ